MTIPSDDPPNILESPTVYEPVDKEDNALLNDNYTANTTTSDPQVDEEIIDTEDSQINAPLEEDGSSDFHELNRIVQTKCDEVHEMRRNKADRYLIQAFDNSLLNLKIEYFEKVGIRFPVPAEQVAYEFVYYYYDALEYQRNMTALMPYYQRDSAFTINGYCKFLGQAAIMKAILMNFTDLSISHLISTVEVDPYPPKRCVMFLKAYGHILLENDRKRKFLEIFELNYSQKDSYGASKYYISNQIFTITDSRPLYNWPAKDIEQTNYDNVEQKEVAEEVKEDIHEQETKSEEQEEQPESFVSGALTGVSNWMRNIFGGEKSDSSDGTRDKTNFKKKKFHPDMFKGDNNNNNSPSSSSKSSTKRSSYALKYIREASRKSIFTAYEALSKTFATSRALVGFRPLKKRPSLSKHRSYHVKVHHETPLVSDDHHKNELNRANSDSAHIRYVKHSLSRGMSKSLRVGGGNSRKNSKEKINSNKNDDDLDASVKSRPASRRASAMKAVVGTSMVIKRVMRRVSLVNK